MKVTYHGQPYDDGHDLRDFLEAVVTEPGFTDLTVVVAWAKRSGLERVRHILESFLDRNGNSRAIVGISEGGATRQGLDLTMELFDTSFVFHDPSRTFHPKIYVARGPLFASLFIGSNNMTRGGLSRNYEAGIVIELDLTTPDDTELDASVSAYVEKLISDVERCKPLTPELLLRLLANPSLRIGDEDRGRDPDTSAGDGSQPEPSAPESDSDSVQETNDTLGIFGSSTLGKRLEIPVPPRATTTGVAKKNTPGSTAPTPPPTPPPLNHPPIVVKRWFKTLSHSDAQQGRTAATQTTGNLKLTQAGHPIDQTVYFRHDFFAASAWAQQQLARGLKEITIVPFNVLILGNPHGIVNLTIDHADYRVANQGNVSTWLHWGLLQQVLTAANHVGDVISLEFLSDGTFALTIANAATGLFIP